MKEVAAQTDVELSTETRQKGRQFLLQAGGYSNLSCLTKEVIPPLKSHSQRTSEGTSGRDSNILRPYQATRNYS